MHPAPVPQAQAEALVERRLAAGILRLTLNRPRRRNPLSLAMIEALAAALAEAAGDAAVRAIVIAGAAPGFCAGHDLKEITDRRGDADGGRAFFEHLFKRCADLMQAIVAHPRIVIAEVEGIATAAGCQLVAACDMALASETARFGVNGIDSGLFCSTPMVALSRNVPRKRAMELLTTGALLEAREAQAAGLVNRVAAPERLTAETEAMAGAVAARSSAVLALGKRAFYRQSEMPLAGAYKFTSEAIVDNLMMADACEGIAAFLGKRRPQWRDR